MTTLATLILSLAGFSALALSMTKHHRDLIGRPLPKARKLVLSVAGSALLAASLIPAIIGQGISIGLVLWLGVATIAALAVAMGLTYGPRLSQRAATSTPRNDRAAMRPPAESLDL